MSVVSRATRALTAAGAVVAVVALVTVVAAAALAASTSLTPFLPRAAEVPGYRVTSRVTAGSVRAWLANGGVPRQVVQRLGVELTRAGFVRAAGVTLAGSKGRRGVAAVKELRSRADARAIAGDLLAIATRAQTGKPKPVAVTGVPGARGVYAIAGNGAASANVYWTEGRCELGVADYVPKGAGPAVGPLLTEIRAIYGRTHGTCP